MTRGVGSQRVTAPPPSAAPAVAAPTPALSKNLRWTAVALVAKMSRERERLSAAVADEIAASASRDMRIRFPHRDSAAVERNTRRRVYDALKVMVSVGCIQREGKSLRWIGVDDLRDHALKSSPTLCSSAADNDQLPLHDSPAKLRVAVCESRRTLLRKRALVNDLRACVDAFQINAKRQRTALAPRHRSKANCAPDIGDLPVSFPFVVVSASKPDVVYNSERKKMRISTSAPFKLHTETDIVRMLAHRRKVRSAPSSSRKARVPRKTHQSAVQGSHSENPSPSVLLEDLDLSDAVDLGASIASLPKLEAEIEPVDIVMCSDLNRNEFEATIAEEEEKPKIVDNATPQVEEHSKHREQPYPVEYKSGAIGSFEERADRNAAQSNSVKNAQSKPPVKDSLCAENAPIICHEELGIPPLNDGDSTDLCSEDDGFLGLKSADANTADFTPFVGNDRHLVEALQR